MARPGCGEVAAELGPAMVAGLLGAAIGAAAILLSLPADLFGRVPPLIGAVRAGAADVAVIDGGTLRLNATVLRLAGVAVPPRGLACRSALGAPFDCGASAARALAGLVRGRDMLCQLQGRDGAGFAQARCSTSATDINRAVVLSGWARVQASGDGADPELAAAERQARAARRGLWTGGATPAF